MIEVIEPTKTITTCMYCRSMLTYEQSDIRPGRPEGYMCTVPTIFCPICKQYVSVERVERQRGGPIRGS